MPEVLKIKDGANWVAVGEEVAVGTTQPTKGQEIWIDTNPGSNAGLPPGVIVSFAVSNAPVGWLLCNGAAVSRTVYADLFAVIGTAYGTGDGSTTFNVPNIVGRVLVNRDAAQTEFDTIGETGGAKTHTLTIAQLPAHNHGMPLTTSWPIGGSPGESFTGWGTGKGYFQNGVSATYDQGSGSPINHMPPYFVVGAYIIKS